MADGPGLYPEIKDGAEKDAGLEGDLVTSGSGNDLPGSKENIVDSAEPGKTDTSEEVEGKAPGPKSRNMAGRTGNNEGDKELEMEMQSMISSSAQETEESSSLLSDSKDRAQMTANTALSLSLIVVLKQLIDNGPAGNRYYYVSLVLVCLSLLCQIVVGLLALVMYGLKSAASRSNKKKNSTDSSIGELKSLRVIPPGYDATDAGNVNPGFDETPPSESRMTSGPRFNTSRLFQQYTSGGNNTSGSCCCPCLGPSLCDDDVSTTDQATLRVYEILCLEQMKALLEVAEVKVQSLYGSTESPLDDVIKERCNRLRMLGVQEKLVGLKVKLIKRKRLVEQIITVQNCITYLMYAITILNAFITGFGLA